MQLFVGVSQENPTKNVTVFGINLTKCKNVVFTTAKLCKCLGLQGGRVVGMVTLQSENTGLDLCHGHGHSA